MNSLVQKLEFAGHSGAILAARLELPGGPVREGVAVLRFDFTGLGSSGGASQ